MLVTEDTADKEVGKKDDGTTLTAREAVQNIGKLEYAYEAVVSVLMLREGWDVPEVSVILLLRKLCSPVYGQQIIGRGLRRIIRDGKNGGEILSVVDHPKLDHNWLWVKVSVSRIKTVEQDEVLGDEDIPEVKEIQKLIRPENIITIPDPIYETKIDFEALTKKIPKDEIEKNWREILDKQEYSTEKWTISKSKIEQITKLYVNKKRAMEVIPGESIEMNNLEKKQDKLSDDELREFFKEKIVEIASELLFDAGFGGLKKGIVYNEILSHIKKEDIP